MMMQHDCVGLEAGGYQAALFGLTAGHPRSTTAPKYASISSSSSSMYNEG